MNFNTKVLHGRAVKKYAEGSTLPPISQVSAFQHDSAEEMARVFEHKAAGYAYSRVANPTVAALEQRINELEGGNAAVACASGMTAVTLSLLNFLGAGDEIIAGSNLYGGTIDLFEDLTKFGITTRFVPHLTPEALEPLINERTKAVFGEILCNPSLEIMDVRRVSEYVHLKGLPLVVDATTVTPYLFHPIEEGADVVIHSTTKYINGSGNSIGGIIVDAARFDWDFDRFEGLSGYRKFGKLAYTMRLRTDIWDNIGGCMAPMTAFLTTIGLETLGIRMERICETAYTLAKALAEIPEIEVCYPLLSENPYRELAERQLGGRGGGLLTFRAGSKETAFRILNSLNYAIRATSIGDVRTLVIHPQSTLYVRATREQQEAAQVYDDTIRISVGLEDAEDLICDFTEAIRTSL
ncbi:MAG: O-acetylhomoserine aminocarboxypropyltransferase/cysteine synthase [Lachnospiraceae bacterium]|nr:O-acetylhomoserine aminocarboxypropyltransferase/cysteine synthase [Lachnospiraceae bacterium]